MSIEAMGDRNRVYRLKLKPKYLHWRLIMPTYLREVLLAGSQDLRNWHNATATWLYVQT